MISNQFLELFFPLNKMINILSSKVSVSHEKEKKKKRSHFRASLTYTKNHSLLIRNLRWYRRGKTSATLVYINLYLEASTEERTRELRNLAAVNPHSRCEMELEGNYLARVGNRGQMKIQEFRDQPFVERNPPTGHRIPSNSRRLAPVAERRTE